MNIKNIFNKLKAISLAGVLLVSTMPVISLAADPIKVTIGSEIKLEGDKPKQDEKFTLELSDADSGKVIETIKTEKGSVTFSELEFTSAGEHNYVVKEKSGKTDGYTYDTTQYNVKVVIVKESSGKLSSSITVKKEGATSKTQSLVFVNQYQDPSTPESSTTPPESSTTPPESSTTPPESSTTPPESSTTPPESSTTPPESSTTPPESSSTPPSSTTPPSNEETPNTPSSETPRERENIPNIPLVENNTEEYTNIAPDPVPLVSLTTLDDDEVPRAVINDDPIPLAVLGPITGDAFNLVLWVALLAGAAIVIIFIMGKKIGRKK